MDEAAWAAPRVADVVGRRAERARIEAFVADLPQGARALTIRGEPGIGKTALWRLGVERSRAVGHRVLVTRPSEEEMPMSLTGLLDLFGDVAAGHLALLAEDPVVRGRGVLDALRELAQPGPVVIAVDDVQWLDSISARALRYAMRRVEDEPVGLLATARLGESPDPRGVASSLPAGSHEAVELGPLDLEDLRGVLAGTIASISRPTLRRIYEVSGGNPLYAIALARAIAEGGPVAGPDAAIRLPESLQAAIAGRLETIPEELTPLLETVAALGRASVRELRGAVGGSDLEDLLAEAQRLGLLVIEENLEVRFAHPLLGSAVYDRMSPLARRSLHARLADLTTDEDARARHRALSSDEPDAALAAELEEAGARAGGRGASDLAADFARHSLRLTPPEDEDAGRRRALVEIVHRAAAGEASRARALADQLVARLPAGPGRAEALVERFYVGDDDFPSGDALLQRALEDAGEDQLLRGRVLDILGWLRGMFRGDLRGGVGCARDANAIADRAGDEGLQMLTSGHLAHMEALSGAPRWDRMAKAVALAERIGRPPLGGGPRAWLAKQLFWIGELSSARALFEAVLADDFRAGNELERPYRLYDLALVECAAGRPAAARALVEQGMVAARDAENTDAEVWLFFPLALAEAWLGHPDEARAAAARLAEWGETRRGLPWIVRARSVVGLLALSEGAVDRAVEELREGARLLDEMGCAHPGAVPIVADAVEALAWGGDLDGADAMLRRLRAEAAALNSAWASAAVERGEGQVLLAERGAEAAAALAGAASAFDQLGYRADAARAVLARGRALLRTGQRTQAADVLADARARFAGMGAALWEARTAEELERVAPGRVSGELTVAEQRVAALVAQGLRNRQIASTLFMSVATVEAHLTRIYRKLEITSRSELTRLVADGRVSVSVGGEPPLGPEAAPTPRGSAPQL